MNESGRLIHTSTSRQPGKKAAKSVILGAHILAEVRNDMERRSMPDYIGRAPTRPGDAGGRKFTADQWKSFCILHLPYTLTRLWGPYRHSTDAAEQHKYQALKNFLHLVSAVKLATAKVVTLDMIARYEEEYTTYLRGLLQLYPGTRIESYQHLMMHFGTFLKRWGPTQAWRCFAFERYNGLLQKIPTNRKFGECLGMGVAPELILGAGEMEETMCTTFCRRQNVTTLYSPETLPSDLALAREAFLRYLQYDARGTWSGDVNPEETPDEFYFHSVATPLTLDCSDALKRWRSDQGYPPSTATAMGQYSDTFVAGRMTYKARKHGGDGTKSSVLDPHQAVIMGNGKVGLIREIFLYVSEDGRRQSRNVLLLVQPFKELSATEMVHDNFRVFSTASGRLVSNKMLPTELCSITDVAHCTVTPLKVDEIGKVNHILPVVYDEVSRFIPQASSY